MSVSDRREEELFLFRIPPYYYIHVLDQNLNVTRMEIGPKTFVRLDNEMVVFGPEKMITVPPRHYCVLSNPCVRDSDKTVVLDKSGQAKLFHGDQEIRLAQDPFPLYPGEVLKEAVRPLIVVTADSALLLRSIRDFELEDGDKRTAGDEWLYEGPGTYIPRKEVVIDKTIRATVIRPNQAIRLRARKETIDHQGTPRVTGEDWLVKKTGAYLPGAYEEVVDVIKSFILTEKKALHMKSLRTFKDDFGVMRKNGEEWLITMAETETHIPSVYEEVVDVVAITTLTSRQYCVIMDPCDDSGQPQLGRKKLGEKSFFLLPGECLERGIQNVYVLSEEEGLILKATETFQDADTGKERRPGDRWMIRGPKEYVPPTEVEVVIKRHAIPLDENEGIYVRDIKSGKVRAVTAETYMLSQDEELWSKDLTAAVETLLAQGKLSNRAEKITGGTKSRDKTRLITYRVPHNAAVQMYDYKAKRARVVFGPELIMLGPDEQFTQLSLSAGKPKKQENAIKSLCLLLGPDFMTDIIVVETADHARLSLKLSYNWHFEVKDKDDVTESHRIFSVNDFVGDACNTIASRVRGAVAKVQFDDFHKNSARIIRSSVFGCDTMENVRNQFVFDKNGLVITNIDIQSVEPVEQRTFDALQRSVQLAIEITTNSQEATARHEAARMEQEAKGHLERQKITDEAEAEKSRTELLQLQASSAAVESTGQATAEAQSRAESSRIEGEAAVEQANLKATAMKIEAESELERLTSSREAELKYKRAQNKMEISKSKEMSNIETGKFRNMVTAIGADTLEAIAVSGPEMQVKMLTALGLDSVMITDGNNPINLFNTASGLIGGGLLQKSDVITEKEGR